MRARTNRLEEMGKMMIEGPLRLKLIENPEAGPQLEIRFSEAFVRLPVLQQGQEFGRYITRLKQLIDNADPHSAERQGMLTVLQFAESVHPYIQSGEMLLEEPVLIEFSYADPIASLLTGDAASNGSIH